MCSLFKKIAVFLAVSFHQRLYVVADEVLQLFGGKDIGPEEYKWFTAILDINDFGFGCSGALIGARYVVTAKHCIDDVARRVVVVGYYCGAPHGNCGRTSEVITIASLFPHSGGDMALLELSREPSVPVLPAVPYLGPSVHPSQNTLKKKRKMTMVGAGRDTADGDISFYVKQLSVKYLPEKKCKKKISNKELVTEFLVCSTSKDGSPCGGDSGSALVVPGKGDLKGRDLILALHTFGPRKCSDPKSNKKPLGHFRMSDAADLINVIVCGRSDHPPEDWCGGQQEAAVQPTLAPAPINIAAPAPAATSTRPPDELQGSLLHTFTDAGHMGYWVTTVKFFSGGSQLVSADSFGMVKVWNPLADGDEVQLSTFINRPVSVYAAEPSPSNDVIASADEIGSISIWDPHSPEPSPSITLRNDALPWTDRALSWHPDGTKLATASRDGSIFIWGLPQRAVVTTIPSAHSDWVQSVTFSPDGSQLASGSRDETVKLWDVNANYELLHSLTGHRNQILSLSYRPDGKRIASAADVGENVKIWDTKTGDLQHELEHKHHTWVSSVAWSPDGRYLVTGSGDGTVRVWGGDGSAILVLSGDEHKENVRSVDWSADGIHVASGSEDGSVKIWRLT